MRTNFDARYSQALPLNARVIGMGHGDRYWPELAPHVTSEPEPLMQIAKRAGLSQSKAVCAIVYARSRGLVRETMRSKSSAVVSLYSRVEGIHA